MMKLRALFPVGVLGAAVALAGAGQPADAQSQSYGTADTQVVVTGDVVRYEPGRILVVRADGKEISYTLAPNLAMPADMQTGRHVSVYLDGNGGSVQRVTTTSVTPEGQVKRTSEVTRTSAAGDTTTRRTTTSTGEVVRYVPGQNLVVREPAGSEVTFTLRPGLAIPADVQVGGVATVYTEPGSDGTTSVSRVITTSVTPEGQVKKTVEETRSEPTGETTTKTMTTTTSVQGQISAYVPGKTITVLQPDGTTTTYTIATSSRLPAGVVVGKLVTIRTGGGVVETLVIER